MTAESTPDQTRPASRPRRGRRDGGFTFIETVLTVVLMGVVIVPVLAAVRGAVRVSALSRTVAEMETTLVNAADQVQRSPVSTCDFTIVVRDSLPAEWLPTQVALTQEYLGPAGTWATGPASGPACPTGVDQRRLAKRITIEVTSPDGNTRRSIQVVKSDV